MAPLNARRFSAPLLLVPAALALSLYFGVFHGWDVVFSATASRLSGIPVRFTGIRWSSLQSAGFDKAEVRGRGAEPWFEATNGRVHFAVPRIEAVFEDASVSPALLSRFLGRALGKNAALISAAVRARGSLRWEGHSLAAADLDLQVSPELLSRLPEDWRGRLPTGADGQKILKLSFRDHELTLVGGSGPLLRASWEMVY